MKSIRIRIVFLYVILVLFVMMVSGTLIVTLIRQNAYKELELELKKSVKLIKQDLNVNTTEESLKEDLMDVISSNLEIFRDKMIYLLDQDGVEIYPSNNGTRHYNHVVVASIHGIIGNEVSKGYYEDVNGNLVNYREYAEPVIMNDKISFVIYGKVPTQSIEESLRQTIFIIFLSAVIALGLAAILGTILAGTLTKPIRTLIMKAREMSKGKLSDTIEVLSNDEIGELTENFNEMAIALSGTLAEISSEKHKLEIVFTNMTDGIFVFDKFGTMIHRNPASRFYFSDTVDQRFEDVFSYYLEESYEEILTSAKEEKTYQRIIQLKDKYINVCFAAFESKGLQDAGIVCVLQDITRHKKLEEMQKEFVANVSHELRTPITTIKSYTETLLDGALDEREIAKQFLEVINNESDRMTILVQDLLDLSKLDNNQAQFVMEELVINTLVEEVVQKYMILAKKKEQYIHFIACEEATVILGDRNRLEQVLRNIISNAIKYSGEYADIFITMALQDRDVVIVIQDTGIGIPDEELPRIFERFYRVDKARSRAMGGTGLGLAIAKEIVELHGGTIHVQSEFGRGSTFTIKLKKQEHA